MIILKSLFIAVVAFVWIYCLVKSGEVLNFIPKLYWKVFGTGKVSSWFGKFLFQCEKCLAGQIALWYYLYSSIGKYNAFDHFAIIIFSIFFAAFIGAFYKSLK